MEDIFENKVVLITGGTGYLGRALTKEILKYNPSSIRLYSRDEVKHYKTQEAFENNPKIRHLIGDVRDLPRLKKACDGAHIVIHAAALKRLDILEYNVDESIKTNIHGTLNLVNACLQNKSVEKTILISTDKACSPINTYGACKFVSERIFIESNYSKGNKKILFTAVRYGNVLESTGSVIPLFEKKILENRRIPLTDNRMTRFIISPQEAVSLVFNAIKLSKGGEVFVPKLPAFKITDLINILKQKHNIEVDTKDIGLRPGEKIHELMINYSEVPYTYSYKDLYVITPSIIFDENAEEGIYIKEGKRLTHDDMEEYSSKDAVISREKVKELFKKLDLIK